MKGSRRPACRRGFAPALFLLLFLVLLAGSGAHGAEVKESHQLLGTLVDIMVNGPDEQFGQDRIRDAMVVARRLEAEFDADGSGGLARLNAASGLGPVPVSLDLYRVLALSQLMTRSTGDAFDVTIGPLLRRRQSSERGTRMDVGAALDLVGADKIILHPPDHAELADSGMSIDLSAIEKGYVLERMAASLRAAGVQSALLAFGDATVVAIGPREGESPFRVRVPRGKSMAGSVALRDRALSTLRARRRGEEADGSPIVDPRSGRFVENDRQATVVARDASIANAWSTALVVDPDGARGLLDEPRDVEALIFDEHGEHKSLRFEDFALWKVARTAGVQHPAEPEEPLDGHAPKRE